MNELNPKPLKTREIFEMHAAIERALGDRALKPVKYAYALARNLRLLEPLVAAAREAIKGDWTAVLEPFERERLALVMKHAQRGEDGNMVTAGNRAVLLDPESFDAELKELFVRHPDAQGAQVRFEERQAEAMEVEEQITLFMLTLEQLPQEIDVATMSAILPMIVPGVSADG